MALFCAFFVNLRNSLKHLLYNIPTKSCFKKRIYLLTYCAVFLTATWTCPVGYARCYGSRQCVLNWFFNDGENDCNIGTDELSEYLGTCSTRCLKKVPTFAVVICVFTS